MDRILTLCVSLFVTICISVSIASAQGFQDMTDGNIGDGFNQGAPLRDDMTADIDMKRVSKAFEAGSSEAHETVLYRIYDPYSSVAVRTRKYMTTLISIPEGKKIKEMVGADTRGFQLQHMGANSPNQVAVTPMAYDIDTNLIITDTESNIYTFYIRSEPLDSRFVPHFAVVITKDISLNDRIVRFDEQGNPMALVKDYTEARGALAIPEGKLPQMNKLSEKEYDFLRELESSGVVNVDYTMYGERSIAPNAVWDDGNQTYISFRDGTPSKRIPALYRLVDGYGTIANYHYRDGFIVVDSISTEGWMLIDGTKIVCIKAPDDDGRQSMRVNIKEEVIENDAADY